MGVAENWRQVRHGLVEACRLAGRQPDEVRLIAVSKLHPATAVAEVAALGQHDFGENYVQEALLKQRELAKLDLNWHFIGHIQSRKARDVADRFCLLHSLDSYKLATALNRRVTELEARAQPVLLQVNIGDEAQKSGVAISALPQLAEQVIELPGLSLQGLMCLPPNCGEGEKARPYFSRLRELRDDLQTRLGLPLPMLSMGMSGDYVQAVVEGSTMIRVGTDIFGARPGN